MEYLQSLIASAGDFLVHLLAGLSMLAGVGLVKGVSSQGTLLHINVDGSPTNFQKVGNVKQFNGPGGQTSVLDATNLESVFKEKLVGLPDEGQFTFGLNIDPADSVHVAIKTARRNRTLCEFRITLPNAALTKLIFFGYIVGFQLSGGVDQIVNGSITVEIDGEVTWN
jgi:hypothetical protein